MKTFNEYLEMVDRPGMGEMGDDIDRLEQIRFEMLKLLNEAEHLVKEMAKEAGDRVIAERAHAYWVGHIKSALGDEEYEGGSATTLMDTIEELRTAEQEGPFEGAEPYKDEDK